MSPQQVILEGMQICLARLQVCDRCKAHCPASFEIRTGLHWPPGPSGGTRVWHRARWRLPPIIWVPHGAGGPLGEGRGRGVRLWQLWGRPSRGPPGQAAGGAGQVPATSLAEERFPLVVKNAPPPCKGVACPMHMCGFDLVHPCCQGRRTGGTFESTSSLFFYIEKQQCFLRRWVCPHCIHVHVFSPLSKIMYNGSLFKFQHVHSVFFVIHYFLMCIVAKLQTFKCTRLLGNCVNVTCLHPISACIARPQYFHLSLTLGADCRHPVGLVRPQPSDVCPVG